MNSKIKNRPSIFKRKYLVKKDFQLVLMAILAVILITGFVLSIVFIYLLTEGNLTAVFQDFQLSVNKTNAYLFPLLLTVNGLLCLLGLVLTIFVIVTRTHRIVGPLVNLGNFLNRLKEEGDIVRLFKTRKTDQLKDIERDINELLAGWRKRLDTVKKDVSSLGCLLPDLSAESKEKEDIHKKMVDIVGRLQKQLDYFKT